MNTYDREKIKALAERYPTFGFIIDTSRDIFNRVFPNFNNIMREKATKNSVTMYPPALSIMEAHLYDKGGKI